ncbi:Asp23/Gls24 family envelope stress response protein [Rathayibacter rathayi]|uniref:Asp23/Gls24 family envelope stress response protein n=1 Tax=Rathayibacter rathayi TaxID=33887 RepID=A0ABX5A9T3_RATRA|nr:Asp23/Gls24 family envelope stress response protein [Rathayibacter rathayi]AZZ47995.1 Asp23/Gls24 family envelope stress response protein [Rathayibacter rathayi]MWV74734.1 Asp23/Gls24 family envelope stress response protein [Rathayibacter rathayi NCPPB 2980 = VKM Ac-1601]PPF50567.1 Asp23/Gls24 family envelope stress response protein [Rathayibacter rathayi]PPG71043.1 Asp23/Gls24 family envelope stress response protein [Rathayibacter rathayi]PPG80331.1 Asp23/Gls24 family envelope stress respo
MNADQGPGDGQERAVEHDVVLPAAPEQEQAEQEQPEQEQPAPEQDGIGIDELSDYLDRGRSPYDPAIEESPEHRRTLSALQRVRALSSALIDDDAARLPAPEESWFGSILTQVRREARAGRDIPLASVQPDVLLTITEGAVRGLVREAGDSVAGVLVGRCRLLGDVAEPGAEVVVELTISVFWGVPIAEAAQQVRERVHSRLLTQTELRVVRIDVRVEDVYLPGAEES